MELKQVQYFLKLADLEHMSAAADLLDISQPALSKSIASLEKELGQRLFDRVGNRIKLNESGRSFYQYAQSAVNLLENGKVAALQSRYQTRGVISINCYTFSNLLTGCIIEYTKLNPDIRIVLNHEGSGNKGIYLDDNIDFVLYASHKPDSIFQQENTWLSVPLLHDWFGIILSPAYRRYPDQVTELELTDFRDDYFVIVPGNNLFFADITYRLCLSAGFSPKVLYETTDLLVKTELVGNGCAVALMPNCCMETVNKIFPDIRCFRIKNMDTSRTIYLARRKDCLSSEVALDFEDFALDYFAHAK